MQALLAARETARESEERFRLIANTAPVMIWMSDVDKQITYVNQPWLDFTGWPQDEVPRTSMDRAPSSRRHRAVRRRLCERPSISASRSRWSIVCARF